MVPNDTFIASGGQIDSDANMANPSDGDSKDELVEMKVNTDDLSQEDGVVDSVEFISEVQELPLQPQVFKTTDRLLDDIVNDIAMFEAGYESGILKLLPMAYANSLSGYLQSHSYDSEYRLGIINNKIDFAPSQESLESGVLIIRGFIYKKSQLSSLAPLTSLYNVRIVIKHESNSGEHVSKHGFYLIHDDELTAENRRDLIVDYSQILEDAKLTHTARELELIELAIPNVIDYGNYISLNTKTVVRVEISTGFFDPEALQNFEDSEIELRTEEYNSNSGATPVEAPPRHQCFTSINKILRIPLSHTSGAEVRIIRSDHKLLNVDAGLNFMTKYLGFLYTEDVGELSPADLTLPLLRESYIVKYLEALFFSRAQQVTIGDGTIVSNALRESLEFASSGPDFEEKRQDSFLSYISLSCRYRYSDYDVKEIYKELVHRDHLNSLKYFDCLEDISKLRKSSSLTSFINGLHGEGKIGYKELCQCYKSLEIPPQSYDVVNEQQLLQQYIGLQIVTESSLAKERLRTSLLKIAKLTKSQLLMNYLNAEPIESITEAFDVLEVNENVDNDLVITALEVKKGDHPSDANLYDRALLSIALGRRSFILLEYVERKLSYMNKGLELDFSQAYEYLGADRMANDFQIITIFQERLKDTSCDIRVLRQYLKFIGKQRKSKLINEYLRKGIIEPLFLPVESVPVGLNNIGNTCYLNSLLQYYFVIEPLRSLVLNFNELIDQDKFDNDETFAKRRIGSRTVGFKETERSYQFVYQLRDLFEELIKSDLRCISPKKELAYLSFSPSTDEVEFQMDDDEPILDASNMQLVPLSAPNFDSPILVDSESSSPSESEASVLTLNSIDLRKVDDLKEQKVNDLIDFNSNASTVQSPQKRRLSSESCELISTNKLSNTGQVETGVMNDVEMASTVSLVDEIVPLPNAAKKNTSATCKISPSQMENALEMGRQQDVTECIQNVLFQLESAFSPYHLEDDDEQYDLIKELFYGKTKQTLQPYDSSSSVEADGAIRSKVERFLSLLVNIGDHPKDIYDALDTYFTEDVIQMDEGDVKRSLTITEIPKVLQIQIQRVQFDRVRLMPVKSIEPIPFEEKLYMDRYMETGDPEIIRKRKQVFEWKHKMSLLNLKKAEMSKKVEGTLYNYKDGLTVFRNYCESNALDGFPELKLSSETVETMTSVLKEIQTREQDQAGEMEQYQQKISDQFKNFTKVGYSLFAIFIHRGEASYGHYWIYIKDPKRNIYRKYNDETVTEVTLEEVFNFDENNTATPYFLVYVKEDLEDTFVDPLRREVEGDSSKPNSTNSDQRAYSF